MKARKAKRRAQEFAGTAAFVRKVARRIILRRIELALALPHLNQTPAAWSGLAPTWKPGDPEPATPAA